MIPILSAIYGQRRYASAESTAPEVVQSAVGVVPGSAGNSATTEPMDTTTGNSLLLYGTTAIDSARTVTDTYGNTFTQVGGDLVITQGGFDVRLYAYLASGITGGAGHTVTIAGGGLFPVLVAVEVEGKVAVEDFASLRDNDTPYTVSVTTTEPSLVLAAVQFFDYPEHPVSAPFVMQEDVGWPDDTLDFPLGVARYRQPAAGLATATWPLTPEWDAGLFSIALRPDNTPVEPVATFPKVLDVTPSSTTNGQATAKPILMPPVVNAGDLLVFLFRSRNTALPTTPAGWTRRLGSLSSSRTFAFYYRIADGTEGGTTLSLVTNSTVSSASLVYRIEAGTYDPEMPPEGDYSVSMDPPPVLATWGSGLNLWIAAGSADSAPSVTYPYTDGRAMRSSGGSNPSHVMACWAEIEVAEHNPGAFSGPSGQPRGMTIAIKGFAPPPPPDPEPWTPASIDTTMWLDASSFSTVTVSGNSTVTTWLDSSKQWSLMLDQFTPAYQPTRVLGLRNGLNVVIFDGVDDRMTITPAVPQVSGQNVFLAADTTALQSGEPYLHNLMDHAGFGEAPGVALGTSYGDGAAAFDWDGTALAVQPAAVRRPAIFRWHYTYDGATAFCTTQVDAGTPTTEEYPDFDWGELTTWTMLGNAPDSSRSSPPALQVYEIIITGPIDAATQARIEGYLAWKWDLVANLPPGHPYKSAAPMQ